MGLFMVTFTLAAAAHQVEGRGTAIRAVPLNGGVDGGIAKERAVGIGGAHGAKDGWIDRAPTYRCGGVSTGDISEPGGRSRTVGVDSDSSASSEGLGGRRPNLISKVTTEPRTSVGRC